MENNTAFNYWVYQQLNPDDIIITGNYKRHEPTFIAQFKALDDIRKTKEDKLKTINQKTKKP